MTHKGKTAYIPSYPEMLTAGGDIMRKIVLLSIVTVLAVALVGCSRNAPEESSTPAEKELVQLSVWCGEDEQDLVAELCESYARSNPDKRFAFTIGIMSDEEAVQQALTDKMNAADVFCFSSYRLDELSEAGVLLEITDTAYATQSLYPAAVKAAENEGRLFGYPISADACILYYDKSKLSSSDVESLETILEKSIPDIEKNLVMNLCDGRQQAGFFSAAGCRLFGESCRINEENGLLAAEYMIGLVKNDRFAPDCGSNEVKLGFAHGEVAAAIAGLDIAEEISSSLGKYLGTATLPSLTLPDGSETKLCGVASYRIVGVNSKVQQKEDAIEFARLLSEYEAQQLRLERLGEMPVNKLLMSDSEVLKAHPELKTLTEQLKLSSQPLYEGFLICAGDFGNDLISGKTTLNNLRESLNRFTELAIISG